LATTKTPNCQTCPIRLKHRQRHQPRYAGRRRPETNSRKNDHRHTRQATKPENPTRQIKDWRHNTKTDNLGTSQATGAKPIAGSDKRPHACLTTSRQDRPKRKTPGQPHKPQKPNNTRPNIRCRNPQNTGKSANQQPQNSDRNEKTNPLKKQVETTTDLSAATGLQTGQPKPNMLRTRPPNVTVRGAPLTEL